MAWSKSLVQHANYPVGGQKFVTFSFEGLSQDSPRTPSGALKLTANFVVFTKVNQTATNFSYSPTVFTAVRYPSPLSSRSIEIAQSKARQRLGRAIKKPQGSLGVTIAQSGQAIHMARTAGSDLTKIFAAVDHFLHHTRKGKRKLRKIRAMISSGAEPTAGYVLAGFFGWAPLIEEFYSAMQLVANPWPDSPFVTTRSSFNDERTDVERTDSPKSFWRGEVHRNGRVSVSAQVSVSNPNLWLANKLGLINPLSVIWDAIPWSFLVNMVSNIGAILGSLTDLAGLSLKNVSSTFSYVTVETGIGENGTHPNVYGAHGTRTTKTYYRTLGALPAVTPYLRFPQWEVGTAAIVGALLVQQVHRVIR